MQPKQRLVNVLVQINKRYSSIFFSKLVLFQQQQQTEVPYIRHYDIQCQAVQTMTDTLNTKIKAIKFRSFHLIKFFRKQDMFKRKPSNRNASFVHNFSTRSFYQNGNIKNNLKQDIKFAKTTRNNYKTTFDKFDKASDILSDIDYSMSALMNKMKYLNVKYNPKNLQDPETQELTQKLVKRKMILNKLNQIQNNLQQLIGEQQSLRNVNHITSSQITLRYNPLIQKSTKSIRQQINKTFCVSRDDRF